VNRRTWIVAALGAVAAAALVAWAFAPRPVAVEFAEARVADFESWVEEDGRTALADRYVVSAPLAGRLQRITLREGDAVAAGAPVATLMPVLAPMLDERALAEQRSRIGSAEAARQMAVARIAAARVALERTEVDLKRTEQLALQGFVAPTKVDADRLAVQAAQKELDAATEAEHVARHELAQARAALQVVRGPVAAGEGFVVRAPVAGQVLKVNQQSETTVALGAPLLEIGDTARLEIVAELLTADALLAAPGSPVRIERWGGPTVLEGRVRRVDPAGFTKVSALGVEEQRVNVRIDITSPRGQWAALGDGFRVGVRVVTRREVAALQVPVSAVFPRPGGAGSAVFVVTGGRAAMRAVRIGARNGAQAWVQEGLAAGERVIVYPPSGVTDGTRVSERGR
jgi:HlyD family secretion protein